MSFFKGLAEKFTSAYGNNDSKDNAIQKIFIKIKIWFFITLGVMIIYNILYLFQCSKPSSGDGTCIADFEKGTTNNTFSYNLANLSPSGDCSSDNPYSEAGQNVPWIDTGFETNGKQLIIYASGNYFPWGRQNTTTNFKNIHFLSKKDDGTFIETLKFKQDYKECQLNTSLTLMRNDTQEVKQIYKNQFNNYSTWNANNRKENSGKKIIEAKQQADCIKDNNCYIGYQEENNVSCVLKNGAGIYLKIGEDGDYAYHIKNHFIPDLKQDCLTGGFCKYTYTMSNNENDYNFIQVPFAIPPVIYERGAGDSGYIFDIRDDEKQNLIDLKDTDSVPEYNFTTIEIDKDNENCTGDRVQRINGICYKNVEKQLTIEEIKNPKCVNSTSTIKLANELCPPQSGRRLFIKPANTCYESTDGEIKLTFVSGVKSKVQDVSYNGSGIKLVSLFQSIASILYEPFFGSQQDDEKISDVLQSGYDPCVNNLSGDKCPNTPEKSITFCREDGKKLYYSTSQSDWVIKTEKYSIAGIKLYDVNSDDYNIDLKTTTTMNVKYIEIPSIDKQINRSCVSFYFNPKYQYKILSDIETKEFSSSNNLLVRMADMENGLFVKVRNSIMKSAIYNIMRIMVVIWFVFSFGLGFINKEKILSKIPLITSDWKRFLILLWCSDYRNYDLIDELLWPALIYGSQSITAGIIEVTSSIYGTSIDTDDPMKFFDSIISTVTSKEVFYKLGAIATSPLVFVMFFFIFPFLSTAIIDFILSILAPLVSLGFTMFNFGQIIMLMPVYALISLFNREKDKFQKAIKTLIAEFIHFAFALGFFGLCVGITYHYFLKLMSIKICWSEKMSISLFSVITKSLHDWTLSTSNGISEATLSERFTIAWETIKNTFTFSMAVSILGKLSIKISDMLADVFAKGGKMFGLSQSNAIFDAIGLGTKSLLGNINKALNAPPPPPPPRTVITPPPPPPPLVKDGGSDTTQTNDGGNSGQPRDGVNNVDLNVNKEEQKDYKKNKKGNDGVVNENKKNTDVSKKEKKQEKDKNKKTDIIQRRNEENIDEQKEEEEKEIINIDKNEQEDKTENNNSRGNESNSVSSGGEGQVNTDQNYQKEENTGNNGVDNNTNINSSTKNTSTNKINKKTQIIRHIVEEYSDQVGENEKNSDNEYRGSGLQENDIGLQENDVALQENDAGLQENDAGLHDSLIGEEKNDEEIEKQKEEEENKKKEEENKKKEEKIEKAKKIMEQIQEFKKQQKEIEKQKEEDLIKQQQEATEKLKKEVEEANRQREIEEKKRIENDEKIKAEQLAEKEKKAKLQAEKERQETIRKGAQDLSPKPKKDEWEIRTKKTTSMKTASDKWSRLASGKSSQIKTTKTTTFKVKKK